MKQSAWKQNQWNNHRNRKSSNETTLRHLKTKQHHYYRVLQQRKEKNVFIAYASLLQKSKLYDTTKIMSKNQNLTRQNWWSDKRMLKLRFRLSRMYKPVPIFEQKPNLSREKVSMNRESWKQTLNSPTGSEIKVLQ